MCVRPGIAVILLGWLLCNFSLPELYAQANLCGTTHFENAEIREIASDRSSLSIADCIQQLPGQPSECVCPQLKITVPTVNRVNLGHYEKGDHVRLDIASEQDPALQLKFVQRAPLPSVMSRVIVLATIALIILGIASVLTKWKPLKLIVGQDNRYSNSKTQMALWFWILLSSYLGAVVLRVYYQGWDLFGGINIPQNLLLLSGLSALTYGGAKAITTAKADAAAVQVAAAQGAAVQVAAAQGAAVQGAAVQGAAVQGAAAQGAAAQAPPAPAAPAQTQAGGGSPNVVIQVKTSLQPGQERFFKDLVKNDLGRFDFGDFQMIVVTVVAVGMYLVLTFHFLGFIASAKTISLPDVDTTILASFGLGQGAYLTKKAAGDVGSS